MFLKDFIQFPPVIDSPLYTQSVKPVFSYTKRIKKQVIGKSIWENFVMANKLVLIEQMHQ
jgi:hypothetical protein